MAVYISVVICCYNGFDRIERTIEHIINQTLDKKEFEIIFVDNASTDSSADKAESILRSANISYKVVLEEKSGLINARARGVNEAVGEIIVFVDDDNWIKNNYLIKVTEIFKKDDKLTFCGGQACLPDNIKIPEGIYNYLHCYAVGKQYKEDKYLEKGQVLWGAGISIKRNVLRQVLSSEFLCIGRQGKNS